MEIEIDDEILNQIRKHNKEIIGVHEKAFFKGMINELLRRYVKKNYPRVIN